MRLTAKAIRDKKNKQKIVVLTAYDYPFARLLDESGIDIVLVGDSLGMVLLGFETTRPVTMDHMLHHTRAVSSAVDQALVVGDMPYRSYETAAQAVKNAKAFKKAGANAVKLEGGVAVEEQVRAILRAGIPVMGHIGMLPQSVQKPGGYKVQGREESEAIRILKDAQMLDKLGVFAMVLECIPEALAQKITREVKCPTIGIGAGGGTDGQVLVLYDMLGIKSPVKPKFVRRYADLETQVKQAVAAYRKDVLEGKFPTEKESFV